jgi:peptidylprolyl isomerase
MSTKTMVTTVILVIGVVLFVAFLNMKSESTQSQEDSMNLSNVNLNGSQQEEKKTPSFKRYQSAPEMVIDTRKDYSAVLKTSKGDLTVDLFEKETPVTVNNFVFLAKDKFYNGTKFHRIIKNFMIQGGDPLGNGTGGPGYRFADEPITKDYKKGILAMANAGPDTNGSQFFIMHADYPLPKNYVIFGQVTSGLDVVDAIANVPVKMSPSGEKSSPTEDVIVSSVEVSEK